MRDYARLVLVVPLLDNDGGREPVIWVRLDVPRVCTRRGILLQRAARRPNEPRFKTQTHKFKAINIILNRSRKGEDDVHVGRRVNRLFRACGFLLVYS